MHRVYFFSLTPSQEGALACLCWFKVEGKKFQSFEKRQEIESKQSHRNQRQSHSSSEDSWIVISLCQRKMTEPLLLTLRKNHMKERKLNFFFNWIYLFCLVLIRKHAFLYLFYHVCFWLSNFLSVCLSICMLLYLFLAMNMFPTLMLQRITLATEKWNNWLWFMAKLRSLYGSNYNHRGSISVSIKNKLHVFRFLSFHS